MTKPLTAIAIANLKSRVHRYEISDAGCQGLRVVVFPSRRKSFVLRYRFRGLQRKLTLGPCMIEHNGEGEPAEAPEQDTPLSLAAARELAAKALRQAKSGNDPAAAKQQRKREQRAAEGDTLGNLAQEYLRRVGPRLRTVSQRKSDLDLICASVLGRVPLEQIKRGQFVRELDRIADDNGPVRSDRVLSALKTLLSWHAGRSDYVSVLGRGGRRTSIRERARTRILDDAELRKVWIAAEQDTTPFGPFLRFTLLTATRRGESAGLHRMELSEGGTVWVVPAARYKSKRDTLIPLSKAAQQIIAGQPVRGPYVFGVDGSRPLGGFNDRKKNLDARSGVSGYGLHDLRRSARTLLSRAGVAADIAEMCLGHAFVGVRGVYDRFQYIDEKREAFEALAQMVERLVRPPPEPAVADIASERSKRQPRRG
jgi:integrase